MHTNYLEKLVIHNKTPEMLDPIGTSISMFMKFMYTLYPKFYLLRF